MRGGRRGSNGKRFTFLSAVWFLLVLTAMTSAFTAAYFTTLIVYHWLGLHPSLWIAQVINSFLGLVFTALFGSLIARIFARKLRSKQTGVFGPILQAMERIGHGDFSVRLDEVDTDEHENALLGSLVKSVNTMAAGLKEWEAMRQEFISNVSHEIQSPLTSIRGFAQALQNDDLTAVDRHHYLDIIENESTRLSRVTENLLRLAALDSDHARFDPRPYRVDKQVRSLILACEPQWTEKGIDMDAVLDEITLTGDEDLLSQVWINLIHNSIKFTPPGGRVCVELHPRYHAAELTVRDTGMGISAEDLPRVFERFFKADVSRTSAAGGSGLGLAIAKQIIEMHGGKIAVESQPGAGTTFTVRLPLEGG
jgi:two-component system, OmpR family, phosphate regulon sensor histidine kinase PhoR